MRYTDIIWDFNGTILDDVDFCVGILNDLLVERGLPALTGSEQYRRIFGFPIKSYYARAGFDFSREPYESIADEWVEHYLAGEGGCGVFSDVPDTLRTLSEQGYRQSLLSATDIRMLTDQLRTRGLTPWFAEVLGQDNVYAHGKTEIGIRWRETHPGVRALYIGDTEHDAETARAMGADCVLIARGHQSEAALRATGFPVLGTAAEVPVWLGCTQSS